MPKDQERSSQQVTVLSVVKSGAKILGQIAFDAAFVSVGIALSRYSFSTNHPYFWYSAILTSIFLFFVAEGLRAFWFGPRSGHFVATNHVVEINKSFNESFEELHITIDTYLLRIKNVLSIYIVERLLTYLVAFDAWNSKIVNQKNITGHERLAWENFTDFFFNEQQQNIDHSFVLINSKTYCDLYQKTTEDLVRQRKARYVPNMRPANADKIQVCRFHITGMLPEEFYNGPQIENVARDSKPIFFCHMWEGYNALYKSSLVETDDLGIFREGYIERRLILVREGEGATPAYGSLSNLNKLLNQSDLVIDPFQLHVRNALRSECPGAARRLFRECHEKQQQDYIAHIDDIINNTFEDHQYVPILKPGSCEGLQDGCPREGRWINLIEYFIKSFHSYTEDSFYATIDSNKWAKIESRGTVIKKCFKAGWVPEIVLFGNEKQTEWFFGYMGHYKLFTRDIELRFLTAEEASAIYHEFSVFLGEGESHKFRKLISIKVETNNSPICLPFNSNTDNDFSKL